MTDLAGNTLARARTSGIFSETLSDKVSGLEDTKDFYRFNIGKASTLDLSLSTDGAVGVDIIHDQNQNRQVDAGEIIASYVVGANSEFNSNLNVDIGRYAVLVKDVGGGEVTYNLNLQRTIAGSSTNDLAGNTFDIVSVIDTNQRTTTSTYSDWVDVDDSRDVYQFTLTQAVVVDLKITGLEGDVDMRLYNSLGNEVDISALIGQPREGLTQLLQSGTYYITADVPYRGEGTQYNLEFTAIAYQEPGSEFNTAQSLPISLKPTSDSTLLQGRTIISDTIGGGDVDTWRLNANFNPGSSLSIGSSTLNLLNIDTVSLDFKLFQDFNGNAQLDAGEEFTPSQFDYNSLFTSWRFDNLRDRSLGNYYIQASSKNPQSLEYTFNITLNQVTKLQNLSAIVEPTSDPTIMRGTVTANGAVSDRSSNIWKIDNAITPNSKLTINTDAFNLLNANSTNLEFKLFQDTNNNYTIDVGEEIPVTRFDYNSIFATWEFDSIARPQKGNYYLIATSKSDKTLDFSFTAIFDEAMVES